MNNLPPNISENDREFQGLVECPCCEGDGCDYCDDGGEVYEDEVHMIISDMREELKEG